METLEIIQLIARAPWREAVTYRKAWPHEYVLSRKDGQRALFEAVCARFRAGEGVEGRFFDRPKTYLFVGDHNRRDQPRQPRQGVRRVGTSCSSTATPRSSCRTRTRFFRWPDNLYLIGTMNTADRSIALVDLALRRRFHFFDFYPDEPPVEGLLGRWLQRNAPDMRWVAGVVDGVNRRLDDRHAAVGPSHFMRPGLDEPGVRLIWNHAVLPYIEEHLFGEPDRLGEFRLDALLRGTDTGGAADEPAPEETDEQDGGDAAD